MKRSIATKRRSVTQNIGPAPKLVLNFAIYLTLPLVLLSQTGPASADDFVSSSSFFRQLSAPLNVVLDGQSFRDCLLRVAEQSDVNVWVDRHVDPSEPVNPGKIGPTVFAALQKIARQRDCVVMPVANVVLVGRDIWVDATAAALITCPASSKTTTVSWEEMTTPSDAFALAAGESASENTRLPHDLWPATNLRMIKRPIAANLVLSQFGRHLKSSKTMDPRASVANQNDIPVTRGYSAIEPVKAAFSQTNTDVKFKTVGKRVYVSALPKAHRLATESILVRGDQVNAKPNMFQNDDRIFTLKLENKPAAVAIKSFANTVGAKCVITPQAVQAANKLVSLEATNKTLGELIDMVATQSGLVAIWSNDTLTIDLPK